MWQGVWLRSFLLVLMLTLGGCLDATDKEDDGEVEQEPQPTPEPALEPRSMAVTLDRCDGVEVFFEVDAATVRPHVPDDFDVPNNGGKTAAIAGFFSCGDDGALAERGFLAVQVTPRHESLRAEGVANYFWEPEHVLAPSILADAYGNMSSNHTQGDSVAVSLGPAMGEATTVTAGWTHRLETTQALAAGGFILPLLPTFREYSAAEGGYAYLEAGFGGGDTDAFGQGQGTLETGEGSVARAILGETATGAALIGQPMAYTDAKVGFVPLPAE